MKKPKNIKVENPITVNLRTLQGMLGVGETTARKIGKESGALVKFGRRSVYSVEIIKEYIESLR